MQMQTFCAIKSHKMFKREKLCKLQYLLHPLSHSTIFLSILFSSALTVPDVAANMAAIEIMEASDERVKKLWDNGDFLKAGLKAAGFDVGKSETPITPVIIGEAQTAKDFSAKLFENGVFATAIVFPTVPKGTARVRAMVSAAHSKEDLEKGIATFVKVGKEMGIIK